MLNAGWQDWRLRSHTKRMVTSTVRFLLGLFCCVCFPSPRLLIQFRCVQVYVLIAKALGILAWSPLMRARHRAQQWVVETLRDRLVYTIEEERITRVLLALAAVPRAATSKPPAAAATATGLTLAVAHRATLEAQISEAKRALPKREPGWPMVLHTDPWDKANVTAVLLLLTRRWDPHVMPETLRNGSFSILECSIMCVDRPRC